MATPFALLGAMLAVRGGTFLLMVQNSTYQWPLTTFCLWMMGKPKISIAIVILKVSGIKFRKALFELNFGLGTVQAATMQMLVVVGSQCVAIEEVLPSQAQWNNFTCWNVKIYF